MSRDFKSFYISFEVLWQLLQYTFVCTTTLLLNFDYQLPCTFERPAASAGDRQLAAPRGRAVGQSGSLQAAVGRFSSQASYGLAWLYKKKSSFF